MFNCWRLPSCLKVSWIRLSLDVWAEHGHFLHVGISGCLPSQKGHRLPEQPRKAGHPSASCNSPTFSVVISLYSCAGERPLDDSKRLCAHLLEKAIDQLDDECETILGIFDLRSFGPQNADFGFVRFLVGTLPHAPCQQHACCGLCRCLLLDSLCIRTFA